MKTLSRFLYPLSTFRHPSFVGFLKKNLPLFCLLTSKDTCFSYFKRFSQYTPAHSFSKNPIQFLMDPNEPLICSLFIVPWFNCYPARLIPINTMWYCSDLWLVCLLWLLLVLYAWLILIFKIDVKLTFLIPFFSPVGARRSLVNKLELAFAKNNPLKLLQFLRRREDS